MPIREFFHLIHVVDDIEEVDAWYDALFSPQWFMKKEWADHERRFASLGMIGDFMLETIEASTDPADRRMPLTRFHTRFGQHWHSLAWYVDDDDMLSLFRRFRDHGVRVAKPGGGFFPPGDDVDPGGTMFTHPRDTAGQLEFVSFSVFDHLDLRAKPGWSPAPWRDDHPLAVERVSHVTQAVRDLDKTRSRYEELLDARTIYEERSDLASSAYLFVGSETVVELAQPTTRDSLLSRDLQSSGEITHSATFRVRDLSAAERHVEGLGIGVIDRSGEVFTLDPADAFGAVIAFTERDLPGDPRA
jgi:catechol 2,3-dioxygenase-like lactoylglutathione lyase family enzyme